METELSGRERSSGLIANEPSSVATLVRWPAGARNSRSGANDEIASPLRRPASHHGEGTASTRRTRSSGKSTPPDPGTPK